MPSDLSIILTPEDMDALIDHLLLDQDEHRAFVAQHCEEGTGWPLAGVLAEIHGAYQARVERRRKALGL